MRAHDTEFVSLSPTCVTIKTPLEKKAIGNHLITSALIDEAQSCASGYFTLELSMRRFVSVIFYN